MECKYCGAVYDEYKEADCPYCGAPTPKPEEDDTVKVKFKQKTYEFEISKSGDFYRSKGTAAIPAKESVSGYFAVCAGTFWSGWVASAVCGKICIRDSVLFDCWRFLYWNDL